MQFAWYFRYPGPDGKFGPTSPKLMDPSAGSEAAVGLDTSDAAAKDDVVSGTMYLPVNRQVDLRLRAVDVIHSFFVPNMRFKQDAVLALKSTCTSHLLKLAITKSPVPSFVASAITKCTVCSKSSARKISTNGWRHGRRRNNNGCPGAHDPRGNDSHAVHAHAAPTGFIRKYIFSLDHKVIGLQYYFLALTAVFVGMFLSLLMRVHMIWPTAFCH